MEHKYIENRILYRLNNYACKILVSSLLGNAPFIVMMIVSLILEVNLPIASIIIPGTLSMYLSLYMVVSYISDKKIKPTKIIITNMMLTIFVTQLCLVVLLIDYYYFVMKANVLLFIPTLLCLLVIVVHVCICTLFDIFENDSVQVVKLRTTVKKNILFLTRNIKLIIYDFIMLSLGFWLFNKNITLLFLLFPGVLFVGTYYIRLKESLDK